MNIILIFELCNFLLLLSCPTLSHSYFLSSSLYLSPPKHIYFYSFIRLWATSLTTAFCFIISRCKYVLDTCNLLWLHFPCLLHQLDASSLLLSRLSPYSDISLVTVKWHLSCHRIVTFGLSPYSDICIVTVLPYSDIWIVTVQVSDGCNVFHSKEEVYPLILIDNVTENFKISRSYESI